MLPTYNCSEVKSLIRSFNLDETVILTELVEEEIDEPADEDDSEEHPGNSRRVEGDHSCPPSPVMQCGPSASWPEVLVPGFGL